jgi:exodeoxyribonuclease VII large subunit
VVTSLTGAAIKDILKVLDRRFSDINIIIHPAQVQGEGAKEAIACAIKDFNRFNETLPVAQQIEVLIVGRGGGSIEDLWAFNEESVARAIYNSGIPVISAVGHERDWTIADLVADLRAATPSVAAEIVVPRKEDLEEKLSSLLEDLKTAGYEVVLDLQEGLGNLIHRLNLANPVTMLKQHQERIGDFAKQLSLRISHFLRLKQAEFTKAVEKLSGLSPLNILGRGYSITFQVPGEEIIKDAASVKAGSLIKTRVHKGIILSQVKEANRNG